MGCVTARARSTVWLAAVPAAVVTLAAAVAEPPEGPLPGGPPHGPADRLRAALDANGDHELDEAELENAAAALRSLDEDGNGRIDRREFRPPLPPPPRELGGWGGPEGRPPREEGEFRRGSEGFRGDGPPGERPRRERSEGPPRGRPDGPPRERPEGPPREAAGPPGRGPGQGPSTERFVERAMSFDGDGDGKLDREEVGKFAAEMMERMRAGMAERMRGGGPPRRRPPDSE